LSGQPPGGGGPFGLEAPWLGAPGAGRVSNWRLRPGEIEG
jgi:hypothetical protein